MRTLTAELLLVAVVVGILTTTAVMVFPIHDDAHTRILELDEGGDGIRANHRDRPLLGAVWGGLADAGILWPAATVLHAAAWLGMALATIGIWLRIGSGSPRYALTAACLSLGPLLCQVQFVLLNPVLGSQVGPLLAYAVFFLRPVVNWRRRLVAAVLVVVGTLLSEYALPAMAVVCLLLIAEGWRSSVRDFRLAVVVACGLGTLALTTYGVYVLLADRASRESVHPSQALDLWRLKVFPFRLLSSLWRGSAGGVLERAGEVVINSFPAALSLAVGLILASLVFALWHRRRGEDVGRERDDAPGWWLGVMFLALAFGLTPILLMGRLPADGIDSRYWLCMLPVASCLTVTLGLQLLGHRSRFLLPCFCAFLSGYAIAETAQRGVAERYLTDKWAPEIRGHVEPGHLTLGVFHWPPNHPWENVTGFRLTGRLIEDWSRAERDSFLAVSSEFLAVSPDWQRQFWDGQLRGVEVGGVTTVPTVDWEVRGWTRRGEIHRILWITVRENGSLKIQVWDRPENMAETTP